MEVEPEKVIARREVGGGRRRRGTSSHSPAPAPNEGLTVGWQEVNIADIDEQDFQFQFRLSSPVAELRRSLAENGQELPIDLLGPGKPYKIIDGYTRCRIARELGWTKLKAFVHVFDTEKALRLAFSRNVVRRNLKPTERANALWIAQKQGIKKSELPQVFGISAKQVSRYLDLLSFSPVIQRSIDGTVITMAHAKVFADFGVEDVAAWKERVIQEGLNAKALKRLLKKEKGSSSAGRKRNYIKVSKSSVRSYAFQVDDRTSKDDRDRLIRVMKEAIRALEGMK